MYTNILFYIWIHFFIIYLLLILLVCTLQLYPHNNNNRVRLLYNYIYFKCHNVFVVYTSVQMYNFKVFDIIGNTIYSFFSFTDHFKNIIYITYIKSSRTLRFGIYIYRDPMKTLFFTLRSQVRTRLQLYAGRSPLSYTPEFCPSTSLIT